MATITVTEARASLPELLARVEGGEEITIVRHGRAVAVVVRPDTLRSRRAESVLAEARAIDALLTAARGESLPSSGISAERADELIHEIRAGRDR